MACTAPSVKVCMGDLGGGQREVVGLFFVGELRTVIEGSDLGGIEQMEALGPLRGGRGGTAHPLSLYRERIDAQAARAVRGIPNKRPFVWYPTSPFTAYRRYLLQAEKLYHKTHLQNQGTNEVDNQGVSCYTQTSCDPIRRTYHADWLCPRVNQRSTPGSRQDALRGAGCERIFTDIVSGAKTERLGLTAVLDACRAGDILVVWKLGRLGVHSPIL